ncbi:MAG: DUF6089 family protein [Prevotella sp.]|nr:DUF6089 family protein [Prevotella sp.]
MLCLQSAFFCHRSSMCMAQDDPEYLMEVGGALGLMAYQGDFNGSILKGMQPMAAVVAKYKMNPRMAWSAQLSLGKLKGSSKDVKTWYPQTANMPLDFSTGLTDFSVRYEYNFWPFGTGKEYLGAKPLTPFIAIGAGLLFSGKPKVTTEAPLAEAPESVVALQLPIGLGVKYKLRDRLNLIAEWMVHFTGTDKLDGMKDPYGIKSSGMFKNTDGFSTLQLSLTYDLWSKCKTCHNDKD